VARRVDPLEGHHDDHFATAQNLRVSYSERPRGRLIRIAFPRLRNWPREPQSWTCSLSWVTRSAVPKLQVAYGYGPPDHAVRIRSYPSTLASSLGSMDTIGVERALAGKVDRADPDVASVHRTAQVVERRHVGVVGAERQTGAEDLLRRTGTGHIGAVRVR
jgi:hypothetical protein